MVYLYLAGVAMVLAMPYTGIVAACALVQPRWLHASLAAITILATDATGLYLALDPEQAERLNWDPLWTLMLTYGASLVAPLAVVGAAWLGQRVILGNPGR